MKENTALSFLISFYLLRDLGKGQTVAVVTVIQTDCWSPPPFTGTLHFMLTFLIVLDGVDRERERRGIIWYVPSESPQFVNAMATV